MMQVFSAGDKISIEAASGSIKIARDMVTVAEEMKEAGVFPESQVVVLKSLKLWVKFVQTSKLAGMEEIILDERHVEGFAICTKTMLKLVFGGLE